jgi:response regulator RpfG family c-di-GMP phosphodiesterase
MPRLRLKNGPAKGDSHDIGDKPLSLGRDSACDIQVLDKGASRKHAEVFRIGEMCFIRDLESRNGTYVNETKVDEELLREGDRIQIGATILVFESPVDEGSDSVEFSEEEESLGQTMTLRLEDLSAHNVSEGESDGTEAARLRSLYRLSRLLSEGRDRKSLLEGALEFCAQQVTADSAYLFAPDPQKGNIVPVGSYTQGDRKGSKVSRTIIRRSLQEKRAVLTSDAMQDTRFAARDSIMMKQIHSVICAPLAAREELTGVLYLACNSVQEVFSEDDLELAAAMAQMLGLAMENLRVQREQRESLLRTIKVLIRASEMRDPTTKGHSERVATYATGIARQLRLPERQRNHVQLAALLHDLGGLAVEEDALLKTGPKSEEDTDRRRQRASLALLEEMALPGEVMEAIQYQEERHDGSGPLAKQGDETPMGARILAVAHEFEQRATEVSEERAEERVRRAIVDLGREGGYLFDPDAVKALLVAHRNGTLYSERPEVSSESVIVDPRQNAARNTAKGRL